MSNEYILKQDAIDDLHTQLMYRMGSDDMKRRLDDWVKTLPPANVVPVVHGEWIHMGCGIFECDKCGKRISTNVYVREEASERFKYCPNCGAKMDAR